MMVSPVRSKTLDLIKRPKIATFAVALNAVAVIWLRAVSEIAKKSSCLWDLFAGSICHQPVQMLKRTQWIQETFILLKPANPEALFLLFALLITPSIIPTPWTVPSSTNALRTRPLSTNPALTLLYGPASSTYATLLPMCNVKVTSDKMKP